MPAKPEVMIVYVATNTVNGKKYVGATKQSLLARKAKHASKAATGSLYAFHVALREHGVTAFTWEILHETSDADEAWRLEAQEVTRQNSMIDGEGYNMTRGGRGSLGYRQTEEAKAKLSVIATGRRHTEEFKQARREQLLKKSPAIVKLAPSLWSEIKRLRDSGQSFAKIGAVYAVRPETVFYFCKRMAA